LAQNQLFLVKARDLAGDIEKTVFEYLTPEIGDPPNASKRGGINHSGDWPGHLKISVEANPA
jgi:hypothetical protein